MTSRSKDRKQTTSSRNLIIYPKVRCSLVKCPIQNFLERGLEIMENGYWHETWNRSSSWSCLLNFCSFKGKCLLLCWYGKRQTSKICKTSNAERQFIVICDSSQELEADEPRRTTMVAAFPHFQGYCTFFTGGMLNILANFCHSWNARRRRPRIKSPKAQRTEWQC